MKPIPRNTLLLLSAAVIALAGCKKETPVEQPGGGDTPTQEVENVELTYLGDPSWTPVNITREGVKISSVVTLEFRVSPSDAAETLAAAWESASEAASAAISAEATYTFPEGSGKGEGGTTPLGISAVTAKDGVLSVAISLSNLGRDFILNRLSATAKIKVTCSDSRVVETPQITLEPRMEVESLIKYLLDTFDKNGDGQPDDMDKATEINLSGYGALDTVDDILADLPSLTTLTCRGNKFTAIDLSKNEKLDSVDLAGNDNLKKIVWKSMDCLLGCRHSNIDLSLCYLPDGSPAKVDFDLSAAIDNYIWKQFNLEANESNLSGKLYTLTEAQAGCPAGWKVPTKDDLVSLSGHYSDYSTYLGTPGRWFSGTREYSSSVPAIFLPWGGYRSSTEHKEFNNSYILLTQFDTDVDITYSYNTFRFFVRCIKEPASFSVSASTKVVFSPGNLQYSPSDGGKLGFAATQYEYLGNAQDGTAPSAAEKVDFFGWGTGDNPEKISQNDSDYSSFTDWGTNVIGSYSAGTWRTLSKSEWSYMLSTRSNAKSLRGFATIKDADATTVLSTGVILLPDTWTQPEGLPAFNSSTESTDGNAFERNVYTTTQWAQMARGGAVFLPAGGVRSIKTVTNAGIQGGYWTSTTKDSEKAYYFSFSDNGTFTVNAAHYMKNGRSVRLVKDL